MKRKGSILALFLSAGLMLHPAGAFASGNDQAFSEAASESEEIPFEEVQESVPEEVTFDASAEIEEENSQTTAMPQEATAPASAEGYQMSSVPPTVYEIEDNNDASKADRIYVNGSVYGKLNTEGDVDWYKLSVPSAGPIWFDFSFNQAVGSNDCYGVEIFNEQKVSVYSRVISGNTCSTVSTKIGVPAGNYYVSIYTGGYRSIYTNQQYKLRINHYASSVWEKEFNDTDPAEDPTKAGTLTVNKSVLGTLMGQNDVDWYKVSVPSAGPIWFDFSFDRAIGSDHESFYIEIYNSQKLLVYRRAMSGNSCSTISTKIGVTAGTYYVRLAVPGYEPAYTDQQYKLRINHYASSVWEKEFNDTDPSNDPTKANSLSLNKSVLGTLKSNEDNDWYKVSVPSAGPIWFDFSFPRAVGSNQNSFIIEIYNSQKLLVFNREISGNSCSTVSTKVGVTAGTYYIHVYIPGWDIAFTDQQYKLRINHYASSVWEKEFNDTDPSNDPTKANSLSLNKSVLGTLKSKEDNDWYKVSVPSAGPIWFDFSFARAVGSSGSFAIEIYNSQKIQVFSRQIDGNSCSTVSTKVGVKAGTYYIRIFKAVWGAPYTDQQYKLRINHYASKVWEQELNSNPDDKNDYSRANSLTLERSTLATVNSENGIDWYKFTVSSSDIYYHDFSFSNALGDNEFYRITLYNSSMNEIGSTEINGNSKYNSYWNWCSRGTYYVKIESVFNHHSDQQYSIRIRRDV